MRTAGARGLTSLTLERVAVRPVLVPLSRPVVSRVGLYEHWPLILIDLLTEEAVVGRSYLAPYLKQPSGGRRENRHPDRIACPSESQDHVTCSKALDAPNS